MNAYIVVLDDGETFAPLHGCSVFAVPDAIAHDPDAIEAAITNDDLPLVFAFGESA